MAETVSPALFLSSRTPSGTPAMAFVADSPITASLTILATLLSEVSFSQPTYPTAAPTVAVFTAWPAPRKVCEGCSIAWPALLPAAVTAWSLFFAAVTMAFLPAFNIASHPISSFF